jgi:hypothetical protein
MKKVIAMSLWVQQDRMNPSNTSQCGEMYCNGAIRNLEIQRDQGIFKDWTIRIYVDDSVPNEILLKLKELGAEIINMENVFVGETKHKYPGMFWRFFPMIDSEVDVFIVRDIDSRINQRDEKAVNEWLESGKTLHIMRDHPHHHYKILGGMWGFNNRRERLQIETLIGIFLKQRNYKFKRMDDMTFLNSIYDCYFNRNDILEHDQFFKYSKSQPFPDDSYDISKGNYYPYVGEIYDKDDIPATLQRDTDLFKNYKTIMKNKLHLFR